MSKPRYIWWSYAKAVVRSYPKLKKEFEAIHSQKITSSISGMPMSKNLTRSTEVTVLRRLPPARQREYDAVTKAIEITKKYPNGDSRLKIIDLVYWKQTHKLEGAAVQTMYSYDRAKQIHTEFIALVGFCMGLEDEEAS